LRNVANRHIKKKVNVFNKITISKPQEWLIEAAAGVGLDLSELTHELQAILKTM